MKFTLSTKPLAAALELAVPNNVSNYYLIGTIAQVSVDGKEMIINFQTKGILSEVRFKGAPEVPDMKESVFVNNKVLKQLIASFDTNTVEFDYVDGGLKVTSGKSSFLVPKVSDASEIQLQRPNESDYATDVSNLDTNAWKFIKNNQLHLLSASFEFPVYTLMYVSESGDVITGDFIDSLFSHSKKSDLGQTCLISTSIADILSTIPENATFKRNESNYLIQVSGEGYQYVGEIFPKHEEDSDMGDYNADIIMETLSHPEHFISLNPESIRKVLSQASLFVTVDDDIMYITFEQSCMTLRNKSINCSVPAKGTENITTGVVCKIATKNLKKMLKPYVKEEVNVAMIFDGDEPAGMLFFDDDVATVVGGVD